jgi:hypothetical protein
MLYSATITTWKQRTLIACVRDISGIPPRLRAGGDTFHIEAYLPNPEESQRVKMISNFLSTDSSFENIQSLQLDHDTIAKFAVHLATVCVFSSLIIIITWSTLARKLMECLTHDGWD